MSYVPPALRRKQEALARGEKLSDDTTASEASVLDSTDNLPTVTDIQNHFWPPKKADSSTLNSSDAADEPDASALAERERDQFSGNETDTANVGKVEADWSTSAISKPNLPHSHSTLNGTQAQPGKLKYVLLFHQAVSLAIFLLQSTKYVLFWVTHAGTAPSMAHRTNHLRQVRASTPTAISISRPAATTFSFHFGRPHRK